MSIPEKRKKLSILVKIPIYLGLSLVIIFFICPSCFLQFDLNLFTNIGFSFLLFLFLAEGNGWLMGWLDKVYPWSNGPRKRFFLSIVVILVYSTLLIVGINMAFRLLYLNYDWADLFKIGFYYNFLISFLITLVIALSLFSLEFLRRWELMTEETEQRKNKALYAQIESLQNQIKPHFLFNNLNAVTSIIHDDPDTAVKFIHQLSNVYRYILDHQHDEIVSLETELDFAKSYVFLSQIRYGDKLKVAWDVDDLQGSLPPYTLQLLLENAIKHNVISRRKPLSIQIRRQGDQMIVSNNLQVKAAEGASWGIGLQNIKDRYELLSDRAVKIRKGEEEFVVAVPVLI